MGSKYENLLEDGSGNVVQSFFDNFLKSNADFRANAGFKMVVIRESIGVCCSWCQDLVGTYDYGSQPADIYARHKNCTCVVTTRTERGTYQDAWSRKEYNAKREARIARGEEIIKEIEKNKKIQKEKRESKIRKIQNALNSMDRRKIGSQGQEIIDKATYNKLTKDFIKNGGLIIRGEEAEKWLANRAYASYIRGGNIAFIRDDATISDVLEEMFHAQQDRKKVFSSIPEAEMVLRREIQAQEYLISMVDKYKIPLSETEVTKHNLADYKEELDRLLNEKQ